MHDPQSLGGHPCADTNGGEHIMYPEGQLGRGTSPSFNDPDTPRGRGQGSDRIPPGRSDGHLHTDLQTTNYTDPIYSSMHSDQNTAAYHGPGSPEGSGNTSYGNHPGGAYTARTDSQVSSAGTNFHLNSAHQHELDAPGSGEDDGTGRSHQEGHSLQQLGSQASLPGALPGSRSHPDGLESGEVSGDGMVGILNGEYDGKQDGEQVGEQDGDQTPVATGNSHLMPASNLDAPITDTNPTSLHPTISDLFGNTDSDSSLPNAGDLHEPPGDHNTLNGHPTLVDVLNPMPMDSVDTAMVGTNINVFDNQEVDPFPFDGNHDAPVGLVGHQAQGLATMALTTVPATSNHSSNPPTVQPPIPVPPIPPVPPFWAYFPPVLLHPQPQVQDGGEAGGNGHIGNLAAAHHGGDEGRNQTVVCVVCGGICKPTNRPRLNGTIPNWMLPILVKAKPDYLEWLKTRNSLSKRFSSIDDAMDQIQVTKFVGGHQGMESEATKLRIDTKDPLMNIPIHQTCFNIADRFCQEQARYEVEFRNSYGGAPSNIWHFYEIWCKRAIATCPKGLMNSPILEANMYFGAPVFNTISGYRDAMEEDDSFDRFFACPLDIPHLTYMLVNSKLQTMDGKNAAMTSDLSELWDRLHSVPQEVFDRILGALEPFDSGEPPPLEPTRVLPGIWWKKKLFSGRLIPWLWDLNEDDLTRYRIDTFYSDDPDGAQNDKRDGAYIFDENMWDWEQLCRQLVQPDFLEANNFWGDMLQQIWNRRRIWKLLDAARLGHLLFRLPSKRNY
ncbi:hypothetical protein F4861DRAFT_492987 [Xylaria intraflava]|nr:hypothetical protein F4861DRAFT_492987 [Xylaria intraflava]